VTGAPPSSDEDGRARNGRGNGVNVSRRVLHALTTGAVRALGRVRGWLPEWANRGLDWVRWRIPQSWIRALTGGTPVSVDDWEYPGVHDRPAIPATTRRLFIGPANFAGQGYAWARTAERAVPDLGAICFALQIEGGFSFPDDFSASPLVYRKNRRWQQEQLDYVSGFTHVIIEAGRPLFADLLRLDPFREARRLAEGGIRVAMLSHGSDSRDPARHAARYEWSPYRDRDWVEVPRLRRQARRFARRLREWEGVVFVSTPDLLDDLPFATWCPVVVDPDLWRSAVPVLERERPVVVHAPSNSRVKGSDLVDAALAPLHDAGVVEYRRIGRVPAEAMPGVYRDADVVLDQFRLGSYGVAACEAMAAGRVVVGNVAEPVRSRVREATGLELPIVQAEPDAIADVVLRLLEERDRGREAAAAGEAFVEHVHSGPFAGEALRTFLEGGTDG